MTKWKYCMLIENFCNFRNPPGFAFLVYKYGDDAEEAVKKLHGKYVFSQCLYLLFLTHYLKFDINPSIAGTLICVWNKHLFLRDEV